MKIIVLLLALTPILPAQQKKVVAAGLSPHILQELERANLGVKIVAPPAVRRGPAVTQDHPGQAQAELLKEVADADAFIGSPSRDVIRAGKKLKWVQITSAGVDPYRYPELLESDIVMTNYRGVASPGIADHAMGMLLLLTRKLDFFLEAKSHAAWKQQRYDVLELEGKTALIVGMGNIGSTVARRANGFGMKVIGVDPKDLPANPFVQQMVYPDRLDQVLPKADVVFVCAPHTPESEGMLGPRQFELMKQGTYFIAVSRGPLYNTEALMRALDSKKLAGAGLDVTNPEPLPPDHPLWKFPNVVITPHIATQSDGEIPRQIEVLKDNIARFAKGEPLRNIVDKRKGY
jgi:phosphoglycerate dehydrogenase-like enzyme